MNIPISEIRKFNAESNKQKEALNNYNIPNNYSNESHSNFNNAVQNSIYNNNIKDMNKFNFPYNNNSINPMNNEFIIQNLSPPMHNNCYNNMISEIKNLINKERRFNQLKEEGMKYLKDTKNVNNCLLHNLKICNK